MGYCVVLGMGLWMQLAVADVKVVRIDYTSNSSYHTLNASISPCESGRIITGFGSLIIEYPRADPSGQSHSFSPSINPNTINTTATLNPGDYTPVRIRGDVFCAKVCN